MTVESARKGWVVTLAAAAILMVTMGARQSLGLFVSPLNSATGLGIATISLALAVGQLMWGVIQPVSGAVAGLAGALLGGLFVNLRFADFGAQQSVLVLTMGIMAGPSDTAG